MKAQKIKTVLVLLGLGLGLGLGGTTVCTLSHAGEPADAPLQIRYSGSLGQSQMANAIKFPSRGTLGVVIDENNYMWTATGKSLYKFVMGNGKWHCIDKIDLPSAATSRFGLIYDGSALYFVGTDFKVYQFSFLTESATSIFSIDKESRSLAVYPAGKENKRKGKPKFFVLNKNEVTHYSKAGVLLELTLELPPMKTVLIGYPRRKAKGYYNSIGIEPNTGELLVGSYHPDVTIYRFNIAGELVKSGGWPRKRVNVTYIHYVSDQVFAIKVGATPLRERMSLKRDVLNINAPFSNSGNGIAIDAKGNFWLSTPQGIVNISRNGHPRERRLGGISGVVDLSVEINGRVLAAVDRGMSLASLYIDDRHDSPLSSDGRPTFLVGGGYVARQTKIANSGENFLVLDIAQKQLWQLDPKKTMAREKPWKALSKAKAYVAPRSLALGDTLFWILDGSEILQGRLSDGENTRPVQVEGLESFSDVQQIHGLANDEALTLVYPDRVVGLERIAKQKYTVAWQVKTPVKTEDIAANERFIALLEPTKITILDAAKGVLLGQLALADIPGNPSAGHLALYNRWLLLSDEKNKRIVRLKLQK